MSRTQTWGRRYYRREEDRQCMQQGCGEVAPLGSSAQWDWLYCCDCEGMWTTDAYVLCHIHGEAGGTPINCPECGHAMMHP